MLSKFQSVVNSTMRSSSEAATKAKEGDIETGDAASELQKKIHNDAMYIKMLVIPRLNALRNHSKKEEKKTMRDLLPVLLKAEEYNTARDVPSMEIKREEKNETRDVPQVKLEAEEKNAKSEKSVKLKTSNTVFGKIIKFIQDLPDWLKYVIAALAFIMYPLYKQLRKKEDEVQESVQSLLEVVERVAQVTEKLASDIAEALPSSHNLKGAVETVSQIAQKVEKDAETAQAFVKMVDDLGDEIDEYLNPLIKMGDAFITDKKEEKTEKVENKDLELALGAKL